jgi:hypothetical protein
MRSIFLSFFISLRMMVPPFKAHLTLSNDYKGQHKSVFHPSPSLSPILSSPSNSLLLSPSTPSTTLSNMAAFINIDPHPLLLPQPVQRPISPTLGLEVIEHAPALASARFPLAWAVAKEDVYRHVIRDFNPTEDGVPLYSLDSCFAQKLMKITF